MVSGISPISLESQVDYLAARDVYWLFRGTLKMTPRRCFSFFAAFLISANFAIPSVQACKAGLGMVGPAMIITVPPPVTAPHVPQSMPLKSKLKSKLMKAPAAAQTPSPQSVDYKPYIKALEKDIRAAWARPGDDKFMPVGTTFKILRTGQIKDIKVALSADEKSVDRAAVNALYMVQAKPLPKGAPEYVNVKFIFENNNGSSCCCGGNDCTCANAGACGTSQKI